MKEFDLEELSQCNGREGKPVYIVHKGKVIDVSESKLWRGGRHMNRHNAGNDLSADIGAAPHGLEVLDRYPQIGVLREGGACEIKVPRFLEHLIAKVPFLKRHPHPMTVHFPIVFMFSVPVFNVIYLLTGVRSFEITALHCLGAGILFTPVAIATGWYTWWLNYFAKPLRAVAIKKGVSLLLIITEIAVFVWRIAVPDILDTFGFGSVVYFFLVVSLFLLVMIIGWFGASLTFPIEQE